MNSGQSPRFSQRSVDTNEPSHPVWMRPGGPARDKFASSDTARRYSMNRCAAPSPEAIQPVRTYPEPGNKDRDNTALENRLDDCLCSSVTKGLRLRARLT